MNIRFRAKEKYGNLIIESEKIITDENVFEKVYYLYHIYKAYSSSDGIYNKGMWIEIDPSTLEIIKD